MKSKKVILMLLIMISGMISCQNESVETSKEIESKDFQEKWLTADIKNVFLEKNKNHLIKIEDLKYITSSDAIEEIRFVLGIEKEELRIEIQGVDKLGIIQKRRLANVIEDIGIKAMLANKKDQKVKKEDLSKEIAKHVLEIEEGYAYVNRWNNSEEDKELIVSYNGQRIEHFSYNVRVIEEMLSKEVDMHLVWGINEEGKMTTVFVPIDENDNVMTLKNNKEENTYILDFTSPCPPSCKDGD